MSEERDYLISTAFDFGGRDISVKVLHDGFSYWTDYTDVGGVLDDRFANLEGEHTIKAPVPDDVFAKIRDELSPLYWADTPAPDEVLDSLLEPIFWEHVASFFGVSR